MHLQEPTAWNAGQTFCGVAETGDTNPAHFRTAMQNAKQAGAGAWTFHNRLGFILDAGTSFKARVQASSTLKELLEGNPGTGVQSFATLAAATTWPITVTLAIDLVGAGAGTVSTTAGLVCSGTAQTCTGSVAPGTSVTLTASATSGTFVGWGGACTGTTACLITVAADALVTATFSPPPQIAAQYYHSDPIGSVRAVTNQAGAILRRHDYFPFGEEYLAQAGNDPLRFAGKERDGETGLEYFSARYYTSRSARFTSVDPGHVGGNTFDSQSWNAYAYARNNPFRYVDPDGTDYYFVLEGVSPFWVTQRDFPGLEQNPGAGFLLAGGIVYQNGKNIGSYTYFGPLERVVFEAGVMAEARLLEALKEMAISSATAGLGLSVRFAAPLVPKVTNPRLANIVDDLFKGAAGSSTPIGSGTTADAVRAELLTGRPTFGVFHTDKVRQYISALRNWLRANPNASRADRAIAEGLKSDLENALRGR